MLVVLNQLKSLHNLPEITVILLLLIFERIFVLFEFAVHFQRDSYR